MPWGSKGAIFASFAAPPWSSERQDFHTALSHFDREKLTLARLGRPTS
jgi:hypothetical protein